MGRFHAEKIIVREIGGMEIVFWDKYSIYVKDATHCFVFHRWYAPRGSYGEWKKFKQLLLQRRHLQLVDVFELADKHGILFKRAVRHLQWKEKAVEIRRY